MNAKDKRDKEMEVVFIAWLTDVIRIAKDAYQDEHITADDLLTFVQTYS